MLLHLGGQICYQVEIRRVKYIEELEWVTSRSHPKRKLIVFVNDYIDNWMEKAETGDCRK